MYLKIVKIKDANGSVNQKKYDDMKMCHPTMSGEWIYSYAIEFGYPFFLLWDDDSDTMLKTSSVKNVEIDDDHVAVHTMNSIYELDIIKNNNN